MRNLQKNVLFMALCAALMGIGLNVQAITGQLYEVVPEYADDIVMPNVPLNVEQELALDEEEDIQRKLRLIEDDVCVREPSLDDIAREEEDEFLRIDL